VFRYSGGYWHFVFFLRFYLNTQLIIGWFSILILHRYIKVLLASFYIPLKTKCKFLQENDPQWVPVRCILILVQ